jgi:hypothetical protein
MRQVEIPYPEDRGKRYRFFEILPGALSWTLLATPLILSIVNATVAAVFILGYLSLWFIKTIGLNFRVSQGYRRMRQHQKLDWGQLVTELDSGEITSLYAQKHGLKWHERNLKKLAEQRDIAATEVVHLLLIAVYNEAEEVLRPTFEAIVAARYDLKKVMVVVAYEERGGEATELMVQKLCAEFQHHFKYVNAFKHPKDIPGEVIGKGGNINYAAREMKKVLEGMKIDPSAVLLTTLDSDNRIDRHYLSAMTYAYVICEDREYCSFQPVLLYTNNIWDVPAPMRVIATANSFWTLFQAQKPHLLRNFSSHAQGFHSLIKTDFWSARTIVEDGHQYWRTYFRYDGRHEVLPVFVPIYQDAVLAGTLRRTLRAQFVQLRRWAWGASDIAYVAEKAFFTKNKLPKLDVTLKFFRLLDNHVSWAAAPLILAFSGLIPSQVASETDSYVAFRISNIAGRLQTIAMIGVLVTLFLSFRVLPSKPARYKRHKNIFMVLQWAFLPFTSILYNSLCLSAISGSLT